MQEIKSEAEFGKEIVKILRSLGFETWQEVYLGTGLGNPCIDIVAKLGKIYVAFELKMHLNDDVLTQARRNRSYVDYTIALVSCNNRKGHNISQVKEYYIKSFGIGVYAISVPVFVDCLQKLQARGVKPENILEKLTNSKRSGPMFFRLVGCTCYNSAKRITRRKKRKRKGKLLIESYLVPEQKECIAGSQGGDRTTPFKRSCSLIEHFLIEHPKATKKEVWDLLGEQLHWKNYNSMCASFRRFHNELDCMKNIIFGNKVVKERN